LLKEPAVYTVLNRVNERWYVGKTRVGLKRRLKEHAYAAARQSEFAIHNAMRKYGADALEIVGWIELGLTSPGFCTME